MNVFAIAHNGVLRENQNRWRALVSRHPVELTVLIPPAWVEAQGRCWAEVKQPENYKVIVKRPIFGCRYYLHLYPGLAHLVESCRPGVVDLFEEPWTLIAAHASRVTKGNGAALVVETEQNIAKRLPPPFQQTWERVLRACDAVVARSEGAAEVACQRGAAVDKIRVVPHGVDTALFCIDRSAVPAERGDRFHVLFVGRPSLPEKGLVTLVEAVRMLPFDAELTVVGAADARLRRFIGAERVRWLGVVPHEELPAIYRSGHACAVPSWTTPRWKEQFGRVVIEAMACGTPVVATLSGAIPEVCGDAAMVVPERDSGALARALCLLREDAGWWQELRRRGRQRVERLYTWDRVADQLWLIYTSLNGLP